MKHFFKDDLVGSSNGFDFYLYPLPRKGGDEHTPPHLHAYYGNYKGKFCICNSKKGRTGEMYEGNMKPQDQVYVKEWIIKNKSKLNRRWRSQNLTRIDSVNIHDMNEIQCTINELRRIEKIAKHLKALLIIRKMELAVS